MCYDIQAMLFSQMKKARHAGDVHAVEEIKLKLERYTGLPYYHVSGFEHPKVVIYTNEEPTTPTIAQWGLVPFWAKTKESIWNSTLNARGETIFDKSSFKESAKSKRCLVYVDGFYEHHHHKGKTYPYFIVRKDGEPMILAGLWNDWTDKETGEIITTFAIVTTEANKMMAVIHNNPKLEGPRMPVILPDELADQWLIDLNDELDQEKRKELIRPYPDDALTARTVGRLRGKDAIGNVEGAIHLVEYEGVTAVY